MAAVNRIGIAAAAMAALCGAAQAAPRGLTEDWRARKLLLLSMEKGRDANVSAIVTQSGPAGKVQIKLEQSSDGFERHTILQPLSMQGVTSVDDGRTWMMYWPDERRVLSQESPRRSQADADERVRLADKNYDLKIASETSIAGRRAVCVTAEPRNREMVERRFYIDSETSFLLRIEREQPGAGSEVIFDTKAISFPKRIPKCELFSKSDVRIIERDPPVTIRLGTNVRETVGFEPVVPQSLPLGFVVHAAQITGENSRRFIAIRITDGLVNATVYQFDGRRERSDRSGSRDRGVEANGIRFRVVGDLTDAAKELILSRFVRDSDRVQSLASELSGGWIRLNPNETIELWIPIEQGQVTI